MRGCGSEWRDAPRAHSSREDHRLPPAASQPAASQILPIYLSRVGAWRAGAWRGATPPLSMLTRTLQERNERSRHHHPPLPHGIRAMHADGPRGSAPAAAAKNSGPRRAPAPAATAAQHRCSERGQRVSGFTARPEQHLVDDSDAYGHQVEIAPPNGAAARPREAQKARARACQQALARRAGESAAALCRVGQSHTARHGALIVRVGRAEAAAPRARAGSRARGRHHRRLPAAGWRRSALPLAAP